MDVEEANDTNESAFVSYKRFAKLQRDFAKKSKECSALEKKLDFMKKNYMRK